MTWMEILQLVVFVLLAPLCGAVIMGLDRKITARIQGRIGPPILQPVYDIGKLFSKEPIAVNRPQMIYAFLRLAFMILTLLMLITGQDSLMFLFTLALSALALIIGGMSVRSPYSRIGSQREIILMVAYEPVLVLMVVGFYLINGSFMFSAILSRPEPLLASLPMVFAAFLVVVAIKLQKSPFDLSTSHHAHQELVKGITTEFAGPFLGVLELAHCYEVVILFLLIMLFWIPNLIVAFALALGCFLGMIVLDNACSRLTNAWVFRFMWTFVMLVALANIAWIYL